jgi:hypothetical protein
MTDVEREAARPAGARSAGLRALRAVGAAVRRPVGDEARRLLARNWAGLAPAMRVPQQMFGRQGNGCGATIGAMPRCDFACRGCYLNADANRVPAEPVEAIKAQMRLLRPILGHAGNLQLTDGEVTLRPVEEVVELLRYARSLDLIPMLMTHGDSFRRRPGLLEQLMVEGGLTEVSIHVDTTQRGRWGERWRAARTEAELNPLREEFAAMVRAAQQATGLPLRAATTMTVTRDNLDGVADVVRWLAGHADAFRLISFQPIAQVGRTEAGYGGGVSVEALWDRVAAGLGITGGAARMARMGVWFGHEACNRMVNGVVVRAPGEPPRYHALRDADDATDVRVVDGFLQRFGGVSFRLDGRARAAARFVGLAAAAPRFVLGNLLPYAGHWLRRVGGGRAGRGLWRLATRQAQVTPLVLVSHHFMSREELETPVGRERLAHCVFHVPVDGELVSMCEVNALGIRERYYAQLARRGGAGRADAPAPVA